MRIGDNILEIIDTSFNTSQENESEGNASSAKNQLVGDGSANDNILGPVETKISCQQPDK